MCVKRFTSVCILTKAFVTFWCRFICKNFLFHWIKSLFVEIPFSMTRINNKFSIYISSLIIIIQRYKIDWKIGAFFHMKSRKIKSIRRPYEIKYVLCLCVKRVPASFTCVTKANGVILSVYFVCVLYWNPTWLYDVFKCV